MRLTLMALQQKEQLWDAAQALQFRPTSFCLQFFLVFLQYSQKFRQGYAYYEILSSQITVSGG